MQRKWHKDVWGGLLMLVLGIVVAVQGTSYSIGTLSRMGPGYFPVALGVILALCGIAIGVQGAMHSPRQNAASPYMPAGAAASAGVPGHAPAPGAAAPPGLHASAHHGNTSIEWRAWLLIGAAIIAFVLLARFFGLLPATFAVVFISSLADRENSWKSGAILALGVCVMAVVVFWWALQVQMPLFRAG
jgi:hypothetical protein